MKTLLITSAIALLSTAAMAAPPPGSCLGGCLSTARAAPTPVFPVDYQCKVNWPLADGLSSCKVVNGRSSNYTVSYTYTKNDDGSVSIHTERQ